jgi:hypothetical protein
MLVSTRINSSSLSRRLLTLFIGVGVTVDYYGPSDSAAQRGRDEIPDGKQARGDGIKGHNSAISLRPIKMLNAVLDPLSLTAFTDDQGCLPILSLSLLSRFSYVLYYWSLLSSAAWGLERTLHSFSPSDHQHCARQGCYSVIPFARILIGCRGLCCTCYLQLLHSAQAGRAIHQPPNCITRLFSRCVFVCVSLSFLSLSLSLSLSQSNWQRWECDRGGSLSLCLSLSLSLLLFTCYCVLSTAQLMALDVLTSLMNSMVVQLMQSGEDNQGIVRRHASEKALLG